MADQIQSQRVICKGGLNTAENFLLLSTENPGDASQLVNYETSTSGGYRRINGFVQFAEDFPTVTSGANPAEGPILGLLIFTDTLGSIRRIAARKLASGDFYKWYEYTPAVGWEVIAGQPTMTSLGVERVRSEIFTLESAPFVAFVDGVNFGYIWDGFTWYQLDAAATGGYGGAMVVESPNYVSYFKGSLWFAGDPSSKGVVAASAPNNPFDWTAAAGAIQVLPKFPVVQIKPFRDELYIFGETIISKAVPDLESGFVIEEVTTNTGCVASDSVLEVATNLIFLSPDGIRTVAGTDKIGDVEMSLLSQQIQNTFENVLETFDMTALCGIVLRGKNQFRYFISEASVPEVEAYGIIGAVRTYGGEHEWEYGELRGIQAAVAWSGFANGTEFILHGGFDGVVYQQEQGTSFNGAAITSVYTTPYLDFGDTTLRKNVRRIDLFLRAEGTVALTISLSYDWDRLTVQNPASYDIEEAGGGAIYDAGYLYDSGAIYGGSSQPVFFINTQGSGYSAKISIISSGTIAPFTIQGMVVSFTAKGRN